ncbi:SpoVA/SpoVAEb family sporulation membrane protein [Sellimonas sp.]|uniref:SpoVA/SpoVAEb family sporulation membrane protein n=1 Tax=Sellimonas sp. TaxID=2021466 RepID=UPI000B39753C|nr:SpoVA/SpoVAEb family sporulation membrane protein [Sellimonas sp.]OUP01803.1 SpoVA protein [Drancourtella sp. An210]OUP65233.1 SpoVA protein [Drancourtella sp. An177]
MGKIDDRQKKEERILKKAQNTKQAQKQKAYEDYVKQKTPVHNLYKNMLHAFLTGGTICVIGQAIQNYLKSTGMDQELSGSYTSMLLVLLSVILTGFGLYTKIAKWGGAGALVPITGFANSVAAPAIEYKKEGQVFGIGCKIFTIAGPVILYGITASWVFGFLYYLCRLAGIAW